MLPLLLLACAYEVPLDSAAPPVTNVLAGTVVINGTDLVADTVILLYTADNPPPPAGTGRPASFATVPAGAFTTDAGGIASAPWALTEVPDGEWLVTALMDVDGNFQPLISATAGSTCGDWLGAYFTDISTGEVATVPVSGGVLLDGLTVAVGREMPTERPAWRFPTASGAAIPTAAFAQFQLTATGVHASIGVGEEPYDLEGPFDGTADCQTAFWTYVTDADGDGLSDAHPNANFPSNIKDFWPRVYLRNVADPRYVSEAIPLPAAFGIGLPAVNTPTPATTLDVLFSGAALRVDEDGTSELISDTTLIPKGAWAVTVVQFTGQTWTLPNELAFEASTDASFDPISQAGVLTLE
jgi:hypothetical protein